MTDPIADMLIRIKNAQAAGKETVAVPFSKVKQEIARVLKEAGFVADFEKKGRSVAARKLEVRLKYINSFPAVSQARRISRPGRRIYLKHSQIFPKGPGVLRIISTSRRIMSDVEARKAGLGGEVLCELS